MQLGILIILYNNQDDILHKDFEQFLNLSTISELCFVDNSSDDETLEILQELKEESKYDFTVVEIKKTIPQNAAKRAGARYMNQNFTLKHLCYLNLNDTRYDHMDIRTLITTIKDQIPNFIALHKQELKTRNLSNPFLKQMFSIKEYIEKLTESDNTLKLNIVTL